MSLRRSEAIEHRSLPALRTQLTVWREEIASNTALPSWRELGYRGYAVLSGEEPESGGVPVLTRDDIDPVQLQLINRVIAGLVHGEVYQERERLLGDLDLLIAQCDVPESRLEIFREVTAELDRTRGGRAGSYALLGESGVGKTFFWRALAAESGTTEGDLRGDLWIYEKSPQTGAEPYGIISGVIEQLLNGLSGSLGRSRDELIQEILRELEDEGPVSEILATILTPSIVGALESGNRRLNRSVDYPRLLSRFLVALSGRWDGGTVAIAVDDVQWCDEQSLAAFLATQQETAPLFVLLVGRPGAEGRLSDRLLGPLSFLKSLSERESQALLDSLLVGLDGDFAEPRSTAWILQRAAGSPLEIVESVRALMQTRALSQTAPPAPESFDPLGQLLGQLSPRAFDLLKTLALLLPPVPPQLLSRVEGTTGSDLKAAITEAEELSLLDRNPATGEVGFRHDTIEGRLRSAALGEAERVHSTATLLIESEGSAGERVSYVLARMLAEQKGEPFLQPERAVPLLSDGARRALRLVIPEDALAFAEKAIELGQDGEPGVGVLELHLIAHEAASLADNAEAMSHHFRFIKATRDPIALNTARALWISRTYAKLWLRGASRIGWKSLNELGALPEVDLQDREQRERAFAEAAANLSRRNPERLFRRIRDLPPTSDGRSILLSQICALLLLPLLTIEPNAAPLLASIILREATTYGRAPYTGFGFLFWASFVSGRGAPVRLRHRLGVLATELSAPEEAEHKVRTYATILFLHWFEDHRSFADRYTTLYQQGLRLGSYEWAHHAAHLHGQSLFFRGEPLRGVYAAIGKYRRRMEEHGLDRISTAAGKFQQAAECLAGDTEDPLRFSGSVQNEDSLLEALTESEDYLGLAGFYLLKGVLAVYGDAPDLAVRHLSKYASTTEIGVTMYPVTAAIFLYGMMAWRMGMRTEAEEALRRTRRFGNIASGTHRTLALEAERANARGRRKRSDGLFRRARLEALKDGFPNEAALIAERHGNVLRDWGGRTEEAIEALHMAHSLYHRWEALPAANRVAARIDEVRSGYVHRAEPAEPGEREKEDVATTVPQAGALLQRSSALGEDAQRQLIATQRNALLLFSSLSEALFLTDTTGAILFHNPAAIPYVELLPDERAVWESDSEELLRGTLQKAISTEEVVEEEKEWRGRTVRIAVSPAPTTERGHLAAVVIRDVSELRSRERELIVADRMYSLGLLAATVAHEVGNPNHILQLNAEVLKLLLTQVPEEGGNFQDWQSQAEEAIDNILHGAHRINEVIGQVKEYGREGRKEELEPQEPREIAQRVVRFSQLMVRRFTRDLIFEVEPNLPPIRAIKGLLEQALVNLIRNACEALPSQEANVCLRVRNEPEKGTVCFAVCDQGSGLPGNSLSSVETPSPQPFQTTRGSEGGTGLGLVIVRSILDRHNGSLTYTSDEEYTTIAEVRIPHA